MATKRSIEGEGEQGMKKPRTDEEDRQEVRCVIDNYEASVIIGKGGANVKQIRTDSEAFVSILKNEGMGNKERIMQITGPVEANANAVRCITELLVRNDVERKSSEGGEATDTWTVKMLIHKQLAGAIIGRGGEIIRSMQAETGARISLSTESLGGSTEKTVTATGTPAQLHDVSTRIFTRTRDHPIRPGTTSILYVPGQMVAPAGFPQQAGPYGAPSPYGMPPSPYGMPPSPYAPMGAMGGMGGGGMGGPPAPVHGQKTQKIFIPTVTAGTVIGKGGTIIRDIKQQTGTTISVAAAEADSEDRLVTINGTEQGIQMAIILIRQRVESYQPPHPTAQY